MATQSEYALEEALLAQLEYLEYQRVNIKNEREMLANLKRQLEIHNGNINLTQGEFARVLNHLNKGGVAERAKLLRDRYALQRDEGGETAYISFLNCNDWCMNEFQVTNQVKMTGNRSSRYDVTILINGLPLVQIELKKRGVEIKQAFNQVNRYRHESYDAGAGLFQYVQIFIISNGVNTKYFSNNKYQSFQQTFFWTDQNNNRIADLHEFTADFLRPCHIAKMITHYIVVTVSGVLKVLRPYQFYATELIVEKVKNGVGNGYIWHTTGSGKTLTSFKASQIMMNMPAVHQVLFVVDRKDLDYQTAREFNSFVEGSVDTTTNTHKLVSQLNDDNTKLIVTTIQKLNNAIQKGRYLEKITHLKNKKFVFIFDECHRSQFGDTHQNIKRFFTNAQMFGFTGTPILAANAMPGMGQNHTTEDLFGKRLHNYVIVDAIKDENVLRFAVEYIGKYKRKQTSANELDIETESDDNKEQIQETDTKALLESPKRLEKIVDYILAHHANKTKRPEFTALFCVSNIDTLIQYYDLFKAKQAGATHPLRIATIFSYAVNEEDPQANGILPEESPDIPSDAKIDLSKRDKLDAYIADYNALYGTQYSTGDNQTFYNYYQDIAKRVRNREVDILLVVNMFLTGFDSPSLNTLYVDKNLKFHGLIQAFSRTNRIINDKKSHGNIVCFRNLKAATDEAIALFSNKDAKETVLSKSYEELVEMFNTEVKALLDITPEVKSVDTLADENNQLQFVKQFRKLLRRKNDLTTFADFSEADLNLGEQTFEDFKSKYLDLYDRTKTQSGDDDGKISILNEVDFELDLIHRDEINVVYILNLLRDIAKTKKGEPTEAQAQRRKAVIDLIASSVQLRSKRQVLEAFIDETLPTIKPTDDLYSIFEMYWDNNKRVAFDALCTEQQIVPEALEQILITYRFSNRLPRDEEIIKALTYKPSILKRSEIIKEVKKKLIAFIETFLEGMGDSA